MPNGLAANSGNEYSLCPVMGALAGLGYTGLRDAILTHPTMAEGLGVLLVGIAAMPETKRAPAAA
jgi:hypothetical protein